MMRLYALCVMLYVVAVTTEVSAAFDYVDPSVWAKLYAKCAGSKQSPIDINNVVYASSLPDLSFSYKPAAVSINNEGTKFTADLDPRDEAANTFEWNGATYKLDQVHVHWSLSGVGSEHSVRGEKFAAELHAVHYKNIYPDAAAAVASGKSDALLVVGVFLNIGAEHVELNNVLTHAYKVIVPETVAILPTLDMSKVIGSNTEVYYTYEGSLTTPNCNQVVRWIVLDKVQTISEAQMNALRALETPKGEVITTNVRPLQARNGRVVSTNKYSYSTFSDNAVAEQKEATWTVTKVFSFCVFASIVVFLLRSVLLSPKRYRKSLLRAKKVSRMV